MNKKIPMSHKIAAAILLALGIAVNYLPSLKGVESIHRFEREGHEVYELNEFGAVSTSSGILASSHTYLFAQYHEFTDIPAESSTVVRGIFSVTSTTLINGSTTFGDSILTQPVMARTLSVTVQSGSGTAVIVGSNTWGQVIREAINVGSGTTLRGRTNHAFMSVSSFTFYGTSVDVLVANINIAIGVSSGIGLPYDISAASDVLKITENYVARTTWSRSAVHDTFSFPSANGANDVRVYGRTRNTIHLRRP